MKTLIISFVVFLFIGVPLAWSAPTLVFDGLKLAGADNVSVDGNLFDVRFVDGTCAEVFSGCDSVFDFTFWNDEASAISASQALSTDVLIPMYDDFPSTTRGCDFTTVCNIHTPYFIDQGNLFTAFFNNDQLEIDDTVRLAIFTTEMDLRDSNHNVYANWTSNQVPIPNTTLLLATGLLGLAG